MAKILIFKTTAISVHQVFRVFFIVILNLFQVSVARASEPVNHGQDGRATKIQIPIL